MEAGGGGCTGCLALTRNTWNRCMYMLCACRLSAFWYIDDFSFQRCFISINLVYFEVKSPGFGENVFPLLQENRYINRWKLMGVVENHI